MATISRNKRSMANFIIKFLKFLTNIARIKIRMWKKKRIIIAAWENK